MDRIKRDRRAKHARQLRKFIMKQRRNKRRLVTNQVNSSIHETYVGPNGGYLNSEPMEAAHRTALTNGVTVDNRWVVPYYLDIVVKYQAHINIEWCNQGSEIKYLFKYINKGQDRGLFIIEENVANNPIDGSPSIRDADEIKKSKRISDVPFSSSSIKQWLHK
ncbi:hypothetical protein M9H77_08949 [Catharanthus roseus]|uniref:Uncharacterized protein n=1 Tax=Catharanthus roseus TaxID=4058 RepID=A0ACC0BZJ7_CATRO|nr:hypothetical protein M9H77_08949 [Catharanthus roseus]